MFRKAPVYGINDKTKEQKSFKLKNMVMRIWIPEGYLANLLPHLFASKCG